MFLDLLFYGIDYELKSLRQISQNALYHHSLELSKQAIDDRFSSSSVAFAKELLKEAIAKQVCTSVIASDLQLFKTVRIKDSTTFELHESLAHVFEGFGKGGGRNSKAGVSIQYEFDIKNNKVFDIDLQSAVSKDSQDALAKKDTIQKGDLIIRDLGYYSDHMIEHFISNEGFFISKLYHNVSVRVNENEEKLDFHRMYKQMMELNLTHLDLDVFIGKKQRPVRLVAELVPDNVFQKRLDQRNKENKSLGYATSSDYKGRAHFNLFICNISQEACSWDTILKLYRIRWQIELVFKIWKSIMHIDQLRKMKSARLLTTLYLKLLWIFINWQIVADCRNYFFKTYSRLLSISKCFQTLKENSLMLRDSLLKRKNKLENAMQEIIHFLEENHWTEKRKKRLNFEDIIDVIFCKTDN
jgi:hypothetical protein